MNPLCALATRGSMDLDVAVEWRFRILQPEVTFPSAEQRHEDLAEILADMNERRREQLACGSVDLTNRLLQRQPCGGEVGTLCREELEALLLLLVFLDCQWIHWSKRVEVLA